MRLKRCPFGLCCLAVVLGWAAFFSDDPALVFVVGAILAAIAGQALLFDRQVRKLAASVSLERTLGKMTVRRGATIHIGVTVNGDVPPGLDVTVAELVPDRVALQDGETSGHLVAGPANGGLRLSYRVTAVVHGRIPFRGIVLSASDLFFETSIDMTAARFRGPELVVQPRGSFEHKPDQVNAETREIERVSAMTGYGIRAVRDYLAGDDLRRIDWKLSAKHDKLLVREYSAVISRSPLIVVDLPRKETDFSDAVFRQMVAAVAGLAGHSVRTYGSVSVVIVSGPNILHLIEHEKDLERCFSELREWLHPAEQADSLYRILDRTEIRSRVRMLDRNREQGGSEKTDYYRTLGRIYNGCLQNQRETAFSGQFARVVSPVAADEIYLFSLLHGDDSHIRQAARVLKKKKAQVHVRLPGPAGSAPLAAMRASLEAESVEVF